MRMSLAIPSLFALSALWWADQAAAVPLFFLNPGIDPAGDLPWQTATGTFVEEDLDAYADGTTVHSLVLGGVTVTPSLPNLAAPPDIFWGDYGGPVGPHGGGGQYGTVFRGALDTRVGGVGGLTDTAIRFTFSEPVYAFGLWVFDNARASVDAFQMTVNGQTSGVLDANPGSGDHIVEGFLGVIDTEGFTSALIFNCCGSGSFEVDHLQLGPPATPPDPLPDPIPEPRTLALLLPGLACLLSHALLGTGRDRR